MDARSPSGAPNCLAPAPVLAYCEMDAAEDEFAEDDQYIADIMAGVKRSEDPEPTTPPAGGASPASPRVAERVCTCARGVLVVPSLTLTPPRLPGSLYKN